MENGLKKKDASIVKEVGVSKSEKARDTATETVKRGFRTEATD